MHRNQHNSSSKTTTTTTNQILHHHCVILHGLFLSQRSAQNAFGCCTQTALTHLSHRGFSLAGQILLTFSAVTSISHSASGMRSYSWILCEPFRGSPITSLCCGGVSDARHLQFAFLDKRSTQSASEIDSHRSLNWTRYYCFMGKFSN